MSSDLLTFRKLQQSKRVEKLIKYGITARKPKSVDVISVPKTLISTTSSDRGSSAIIKIVSNKFKKESNSSSTDRKLFETFTVSQSTANTKLVVPNVKDKSATSTSVELCSINETESITSSYPDTSEDVTNTDSTSEYVSQTPQKVYSNTLKRNRASTDESPPVKIIKNHGSQCCLCCRKTLEIILKQQTEILQLLKKTSKSTVIPVHVPDKLDLLPSMPFHDINDFFDFDESLNNENVQYQFMVKLNKLLVSTEQKSISNIMSSILTNDLCKTISWIGVKDTVAFGSSNMVGLIIDLLQEHHQINIDSIKSRIAEWLRRCGDRINNELKRQQKRLEHGYAIKDSNY